VNPTKDQVKNKYGADKYVPTADTEKGVYPPNVSSEIYCMCVCLYAVPTQEQTKPVILNQLYMLQTTSCCSTFDKASSLTFSAKPSFSIVLSLWTLQNWSLSLFLSLSLSFSLSLSLSLSASVSLSGVSALSALYTYETCTDIGAWYGTHVGIIRV
jgi:hypothetical protein